MLSGRNDNYINVQCLRSGPPNPDGLPPVAGARRLVTTRHATVHQNASNWRDLWPHDASIWKRRQHPFACLTLRVCSPSHSLASQTHTHTLAHRITHETHCARWLTGTTDCSTSQTPFQTCDNWLTAHWGLLTGREHMLYLPTSRGHRSMAVRCTTLKFVGMNSDINSNLKILIKTIIIFFKHKTSSCIFRLINFKCYTTVLDAMLL